MADNYFPFTYTPDNLQHRWVIIDEAQIMTSPACQQRHPPILPHIIVPFPPQINAKDLIDKQNKKGKKATKPPNAFMIYRMRYVQQLHSKGYRLPMRDLSPLISKSWREQPDMIVQHYEQLAKEASSYYNEVNKKIPKRQPEPRLPFSKSGSTHSPGYMSAKEPIHPPPNVSRTAPMRNSCTEPYQHSLCGNVDKNYNQHPYQLPYPYSLLPPTLSQPCPSSGYTDNSRNSFPLPSIDVISHVPAPRRLTDTNNTASNAYPSSLYGSWE
ncbi:614_t:CDS:1 [Paraglomus brasilianum]|uniref:614_t:CDS:1 n=1 Tax=Paraglomus brasilianum TaxID=144538 RepID=A0A9N9C2N4_9GLOM|nr:614_t:CDS:1 [Paraglomus brasilianum]